MKIFRQSSWPIARLSLRLLALGLLAWPRLSPANPVFAPNESGLLLSFEHESLFAKQWNPAYSFGAEAVKSFPTGSLDVGASTSLARMQPPALGADAWGHTYATSLAWDVKPYDDYPLGLSLGTGGEYGYVETNGPDDETWSIPNVIALYEQRHMQEDVNSIFTLAGGYSLDWSVFHDAGGHERESFHTWTFTAVQDFILQHVLGISFGYKHTWNSIRKSANAHVVTAAIRLKI